MIGVTKLTTGFDLQRASVLFNLRSTPSVILATQGGGRVLRLDVNNPDKHAVIVDFIYNDNRRNAQPVLFSQIVGQSEVYPKSYDQNLAKNTSEKDNSNETKNELPIFDIEGLEVIVTENEIIRVTKAVEENRETKKFTFQDVQ